MRFRVHPEAKREAEEAILWYNERSPGVGAQVQQCIDGLLDAFVFDEILPSVSLPGSGCLPARGVRRLVFDGFPYDLVFAQREGEYVVLAFDHHKRRPGYWRHRMK